MTDSKESEVPKLEPPVPKEIIESKYSIRKKVWGQLWKEKLVKFPTPFGRIPNFIGVKEASAKLLELDAFKSAKAIEICSDKPLESARALALENEKDLYVSCPGLVKSFIKKLELDSKHDTKLIVSRWGIEHTGKEVDIKEEVHIDLLVLGSVAVSRDGYRIGKGGGFADMEFALFKEMKAINDQVVIVTIVHDLQVFDELPKDIFKKYDVPIDYIITPTQTIEVKHNLPRPEGLFWNELTLRQVEAKTLLRELKQKHESEGRETTLKEHNPEERSNWPPYVRFFRSKSRPRPLNDRTNKKAALQKNENSGARTKSAKKFDRTKPSDNKENTEDMENVSPQTRLRKKKKRPHTYYSLRVSNIQKSVRVRDLKNALIEKGIKPRNITWKGSRGFCFLHYSKKNQNKKEDEAAAKAEEGSDAINSVIELIQELKINPDAEKNFTVKVMEPITRIETVNVTSV